jgi:hypothetical protein
MKAVIIRDYFPLETLGTFVIIDKSKLVWNCVCIELPSKENKQKISCINPGTYPVKKIVSEKHGHCFLLSDVPGRSAVQIHIGNYAAGVKVDTEGCILPGMYFADLNKDGISDVAGSTDAMGHLLQMLPNSFNLTII